jgi:hypothetical protein
MLNWKGFGRKRLWPGGKPKTPAEIRTANLDRYRYASLLGLLKYEFELVWQRVAGSVVGQFVSLTSDKNVAPRGRYTCFIHSFISPGSLGSSAVWSKPPQRQFSVITQIRGP